MSKYNYMSLLMSAALKLRKQIILFFSVPK